MGAMRFRLSGGLALVPGGVAGFEFGIGPEGEVTALVAAAVQVTTTLLGKPVTVIGEDCPIAENVPQRAV